MAVSIFYVIPRITTIEQIKQIIDNETTRIFLSKRLVILRIILNSHETGNEIYKNFQIEYNIKTVFIELKLGQRYLLY